MIQKFLLLVLACIAMPVYASKPLDAQIQLLLDQITASQCLFIRNGKTHTASESVKHINRKYAHYEDEIDSVETFIKLTATKSLITGSAYQVQCDGQIMTSAEWMHGKVQALGLQS